MNILILMVDEMAPWGCGDGVITPAIDRLRARGREFRSAYTPSPICVPTRAAIATGRHIHEIGCWSSAEAYDGSQPSFAHQTRDAGYETVSFGKLHYRNGTDDTGFEAQVHPTHIPGGIGWVRGLLRQPLAEYDITAELAEQVGPGETDYQVYDRQVAASAADWIMDPSRAEKPWCAFVSFFSPHYPLIAPSEDYALYDAAPRDAEPVPDHPVLRQMWAFWDHDRHFTPERRGMAHAAYRGLCTFVDRQLGKVLDALDRSGQTDETLVLFASDHGDMMGQHGFWVKSVMYENSAGVPLIVAGPGVAPGSWEAPVSLIDIAPTIAEALGLDGSGYSGVSLLSPQSDRMVISEYHDGGSPVGLTMIRWNDDSGRWKYVHYAEGYPAQMFELGSDPRESDDLASRMPQRVAEAQRRLAELVDVEAVNIRALADQAVRIEELGGRQRLLDMEVWNFTPAGSGQGG